MPWLQSSILSSASPTKHKTNPHPWLVSLESGDVWSPLGTQARERAVGERREKKKKKKSNNFKWAVLFFLLLLFFLFFTHFLFFCFDHFFLSFLSYCLIPLGSCLSVTLQTVSSSSSPRDKFFLEEGLGQPLSSFIFSYSSHTPFICHFIHYGSAEISAAAAGGFEP